MKPKIVKQGKWTREQKSALWAVIIAVLAMVAAFFVPEVRRKLGLEKPDIASTSTQNAPSPKLPNTQEPSSPVQPLPAEPTTQRHKRTAAKDKVAPTVTTSGDDNPAIGSIAQGPCSNLQIGGSNNQAQVNCAPEWHLSDVQRSQWSEFVATLPQQCAEIVVVGDIPDKNSHDFAVDIFEILNEHHKVNRFGHLLSGDFGEGVAVQVVLCPSCAQVQQRGVRRITAVEQFDSNQRQMKSETGAQKMFLISEPVERAGSGRRVGGGSRRRSGGILAFP